MTKECIENTSDARPSIQLSDRVLCALQWGHAHTINREVCEASKGRAIIPYDFRYDCFFDDNA